MANKYGPGRLPVDNIYAGDDWTRVIEVRKKGSLVDLEREGWLNIRAQWRPTPGTGWSLDIDVDDSKVTDGVFILSMTGEQTEQMGGDGIIDVETTAPDGRVTTRLIAPTKWTQDVTR